VWLGSRLLTLHAGSGLVLEVADQVFGLVAVGAGCIMLATTFATSVYWLD
jgi:hypothetical protein